MKLRAQTKALRSFRRAVHPAGRTADGHPLFTIDSLKLALPRGARHFHRVLACSRCGGEIVEWDRAVSGAQDLNAQTRERLCENCSQVPPRARVAAARRPARRPPFPASMRGPSRPDPPR
jgi:formylmethanofuran dehydrogenase subunit E